MKRIFVIIFFALNYFIGYSRCNIVQPQKAETELTRIFTSLNTNILKSKDERTISNYLTPINNQSVDYVLHTYRVNLLDFYDRDDATLTFVGCLVACNEVYHNPSETQRPYIGQLISCFMEGFGIANLADFISQAISGEMTVSTILGIIKKFVKRYVGWIGLAVGIYEAGDCMGWW